MQINKIAPAMNNHQNGQKSFGTTPVNPKTKIFEPVSKPYNTLMDTLTDKIAKGLGKIADQNWFQNFIKKTNDSKFLHKHLTQNLATTYSIILSGMYINKTLSNEKLDEKRRKTLAVNQGIVWGLSTIISYTCDNAINKKVDNFIAKFKQANAHKPAEAINKYVEGIKIAKSIMIFDMVYRFIAPVVVTPIANHIGNRINEKNDAKTKGGIK